jgi:chemotaxis protein methyltransferase CheR
LPEVGSFDVIFLRNVMIYFDQPTKQKVVAHLARKLRHGGHFVIGYSETLNGINNELRPIQPTIYQKP